MIDVNIEYAWMAIETETTPNASSAHALELAVYEYRKRKNAIENVWSERDIHLFQLIPSTDLPLG